MLPRAEVNNCACLVLVLRRTRVRKVSPKAGEKLSFDRYDDPVLTFAAARLTFRARPL